VTSGGTEDVPYTLGGSAVTDSAQITVEDDNPTLPNAQGPAQDTDGDGQLEDVDGSGTTDIFDAIALYNSRNSDAVQNNIDAFDFDGSGSVDLFDAIELYNEINA
jgi:PKD repeat protein